MFTKLQIQSKNDRGIITTQTFRILTTRLQRIPFFASQLKEEWRNQFKTGCDPELSTMIIKAEYLDKVVNYFRILEDRRRLFALNESDCVTVLLAASSYCDDEAVVAVWGFLRDSWRDPGVHLLQKMLEFWCERKSKGME